MKNPCGENNVAYKSQWNKCVKLLRHEKRRYYNNLNLKCLTGNRTFWRTVKPFISTPYAVDDDINVVLQKLKSDYLQLTEWLSVNYMKDNDKKLQLLVPNKVDDISIIIGRNDIEGSRVVKLLGVKVDNKRRFDDHISSLCKKASQKLHALARISTHMCSSKLKNLMKSFIISQFCYCAIVWMFHSRMLNHRINRIYESALILAYNDYLSSFESLLDLDKSVTIHTTNLQLLPIEMCKIVNGLAPPIMSSLLPLNCNNRDLRSKRTFQTYNVKPVYNGTEIISFRGPMTWELVSNHIKASKSLSEFKSKIKQWKFTECTCRIYKTYIQNVGFV